MLSSEFLSPVQLAKPKSAQGVRAGQCSGCGEGSGGVSLGGIGLQGWLGEGEETWSVEGGAGQGAHVGYVVDEGRVQSWGS